MSRFLSNRFTSFDAYIPGEQPSDMEYIKLNTNESPFQLPESITRAAESETDKLRLYPDPDSTRLVGKLSECYSVRPENVIVGNGSDELLAFSFHAFFEKGVVFPDITYGFYPVYAKLYNIPYKEIPLKDDFSVDINAYTGIGSNIIIANPNAPTGIVLDIDDVEKIVKSNPGFIVVVDEAYIDFGGKSAVQLTQKYDNLLVIHTFSKSRSLAGARLGFAIGPAPVIEDLTRMKYSFNPYNVNRLTQIMGEAAVDEEAFFVEKRREIIETREKTVKRLNLMNFILTNSSANFLFGKHPDINGFDLYSKLKDMGILVRQWNRPRISDYVRITIGTEEQMDTLIAAIDKILEEMRK